MSNNLELGNIEYQFDPEAVFEKDGKEYKFISFKKITTFKGKGDSKENKKYQNLTVKNDHWAEFSEWLREILVDIAPF